MSTTMATMHLADLARHDVVSVADARSLGIDAAALRRLARDGVVMPLIRGWYAVRAPGQPPPWAAEGRFATDLARHRLRTAALVRHFDGRAVASHHSALVLHDVDLLQSDLSTVHLCRTHDLWSRRRTGAAIHESVGLPPVPSPGGLLGVPVATAVVQSGLVNPPVEALVTGDSALHKELCTEEQVRESLDRHGHVTGVAAVRLLLEHLDGRYESPGETLLAQVLRGLGYAFTPQVWVTAEGRRWRVDDMLDDLPVVIEFDGMTKYRKDEDALPREKWREDKLRRRGYQVVRVVWRELWQPDLIRAAVEQARADALMNPRSAPLGGALAHISRFSAVG